MTKTDENAALQLSGVLDREILVLNGWRRGADGVEFTKPGDLFPAIASWLVDSVARLTGTDLCFLRAMMEMAPEDLGFEANPYYLGDDIAELERAGDRPIPAALDKVVRIAYVQKHWIDAPRFNVGSSCLVAEKAGVDLPGPSEETQAGDEAAVMEFNEQTESWHIWTADDAERAKLGMAPLPNPPQNFGFLEKILEADRRYLRPGALNSATPRKSAS